MKKYFEPLPFHPPPNPKETIGQWIDRLARTNRTSFKVMFWYILKLTKKEENFIQVLSDLTGIPTEDISEIRNEFKELFWLDFSECPIRYCNFKSKNKNHIFQHLQIHKIGIEWHDCPYCGDRLKSMFYLEKHIQKEHNPRVIRFTCSHCNYKTKYRDVLTNHLKKEHQIDLTFGCPFCDFRHKHRSRIKAHLKEDHPIELIFPDKDLFNYLDLRF